MTFTQLLRKHTVEYINLACPGKTESPVTPSYRGQMSQFLQVGCTLLEEMRSSGQGPPWLMEAISFRVPSAFPSCQTHNLLKSMKLNSISDAAEYSSVTNYSVNSLDTPSIGTTFIIYQPQRDTYLSCMWHKLTYSLFHVSRRRIQLRVKSLDTPQAKRKATEQVNNHFRI